MKYNLNWAKSNYENDERTKYLFYWGHRPRKDGQIGKSCLSQWWENEFEVDNVKYSTAEHWMMAKKAELFKDDEILDKILSCKTPHEAKKLGRMVKNFDQKVWETNRYNIVKMGNYHKFKKDEKLLAFLLATSGRILVEASPYDAIWGIGLKADAKGIENPNNWKGLNLLGFAQMEVRDILIEEM